MSLSTDIKVCVLMGGVGAERAVSLDSGRNIAAAIRQAGVECVEFDITPDDMSILDDTSIDVFFLGLHGKFGEDGELQQILEDRKLVYTGRAVDQPRDESLITVYDLDRTMEEVTTGKTVTVPLTNPIGCNVKWDGKEKHWMPADACDLV